MPEGPSIVILREAIEELGLKGKVVRHAEGNAKIDKDRLIGNKVTDFRSWGKHFLICFEDFTIRIHFLLFGSYLIDEQKKTPPRLSLIFDNHELNFYTSPSSSLRRRQASSTIGRPILCPKAGSPPRLSRS